MSKYMDLVLCQHDGFEKPNLFRAPAWTRLKKGDRVIVENLDGRGKAEATIQGIMTVNVTEDKDDFDFILLASGATTPLKKVLSKVFLSELEYENDEEDENE